ncbi:hypothetical protein CHLNCDRAFT_53494 [Chlorella variabilis]|uniref:Peptidase M28 domain-containing protein n=1 Tax=Chlorella variabilis TaxID=554065 RepID=E1ZK18_CHLVA|nr:hypothetical protein CHLNCDRAFT_53494 [Chlorella variabilis]EFN53618.1 hypothetical protein CHLNCDRAFT_53494 [Chlorella variabilis]|eukprot:XP_005845720.1 hypothetical protein CHLNCDRAFT_53494 [Chlorella variabilis]
MASRTGPGLLFAAGAIILLAGGVAAAAADKRPQLSDETLYQLLYVEPNHYLQSLGNISDVPGSLSRTFLSPAHRRAAGRLRRWMASAGMRTWADQMANVHGIVKASDPEAPTIILGSHYDTVVDGGNNANFTLDIRSRWDKNRKQVIQQLKTTMEAVCARRKLQCRLYVKNEAAAVEANPELVEGLLNATVDAESLVARLLAQARLHAPPAPPPAATCAAPADGGMQGTPCAEPPADTETTDDSDAGADGDVTGDALVSGAGHDAMVFAEVTKMGMLFVRCRDGISHSPLEHVTPDDVAAATATLYRYLRKHLLFNT